jgi:hypothetical protein
MTMFFHAFRNFISLYDLPNLLTFIAEHPVQVGEANTWPQIVRHV